MGVTQRPCKLFHEPEDKCANCDFIEESQHKVTLKCWHRDCVIGVSYEGPMFASGDYASKSGVVHVGWVNGELTRSASCADHMREAAQKYWDLYAKKYGRESALKNIGSRP